MFKNMNIGKKILITFIFVAILSSIAGIAGLSETTNMNSSYSYALSNYGFSQGDIGLFSTEFNNSSSIMKDIIISTQTKTLSVKQFNESNALVNSYFGAIKKSLVTEKELNLYNDIKNNLAKYEQAKTKVIALATQNKNDEAGTLLTETIMPITTQIRIATEALIFEKTKEGNQISKNLTSQATVVNRMILSTILFCFLLSLLIALTISRSISKPVKKMVDASEQMAAGKLNVHIDVNSKNEIGQLGSSFSETIRTLHEYIIDIKQTLAKIQQGDLTATSNLEYKGDFIELQKSIEEITVFVNDTITQMREASEQVASGSEQVSNGAQALAQGTAEQANSIEELSSSITEISLHVKDNAENAIQASARVNQARSEIEISNRHMGEMVTAMSQINESSSRIGKIIKAIEDIAFQTNILALNAAVEAARAGTAGKGFAVVADEVRNLASKSAEAAKDTTSLIQNSVNQVTNGTRVADETAKSLLRVMESTRSVSDTVEKISQASNRQSSAIDQIVLGLDKISAVVQTNSATAEESAAASEELSGQAHTLKDLVGKFKLQDRE